MFTVWHNGIYVIMAAVMEHKNIWRRRIHLNIYTAYTSIRNNDSLMSKSMRVNFILFFW